MTRATDCDDGDPEQWPGASESCNDDDDDCDGRVDEDSLDARTWFVDGDGDGHGVSLLTQIACDPPSGYAATDDDCDDHHAEASPSGVEVCDGLDNDCSGVADGADALDATDWFQDGDGDGHGDPILLTRACDAPVGFVAGDQDCDDADPAISPDATEVCNDSVDNDCDGGPGSCRLQGTWTLDDADQAWWGNGSGSEGESLSYGEQDYMGVGPGAQAGTAVAVVDLDGDGLAEVVVGAPLELVDFDEEWLEALDPDDDGYAEGRWCDDGDQAGGAIYVVPGQVTDASGPFGTAPGPEARLEEEAASWWTGEPTARDGDCAYQVGVGRSLVLADLDGDGVQDLVAGMPAYNDGWTDEGDDGGAVALALGPFSTGSVSWDALLAAPEGGLALGAALASADQDADGSIELLLGAPGGAGRTVLVPGTGWGVDEVLGTDLAWLDGDGEETLGEAVAMCDLVSSGGGSPDGLPDLVLGAPMADDGGAASGAVYVLAGPVTGSGAVADEAALRITGEDDDDLAGTALACADLDGDGTQDLLVGAPGAEQGDGAVYGLLGPLGAGELDLASADLILRGEASAAQGLGAALAASGDLDGDGVLDVVLGATDDDENGSDGDYAAGAVWLVYGPVTANLQLPVSGDAGAKLLGSDWDDHAGAALATGADVNGDGVDDLLIGAPRADDPDGTWSASVEELRCSKASEGGCTDPPGGAYLVLGRGL